MDDPILRSDSVQEAMRIASSPEAAQLKALLQQSNAQGLRQAMEQAAQGDYAAAKNTINAFLATPEAKELLDQLRKNP